MGGRLHRRRPSRQGKYPGVCGAVAAFAGGSFCPSSRTTRAGPAGARTPRPVPCGAVAPGPLRPAHMGTWYHPPHPPHSSTSDSTPHSPACNRPSPLFLLSLPGSAPSPVGRRRRWSRRPQRGSGPCSATAGGISSQGGGGVQASGRWCGRRRGPCQPRPQEATAYGRGARQPIPPAVDGALAAKGAAGATGCAAPGGRAGTPARGRRPGPTVADDGRRAGVASGVVAGPSARPPPTPPCLCLGADARGSALQCRQGPLLAVRHPRHHHCRVLRERGMPPRTASRAGVAGRGPGDAAPRAARVPRGAARHKVGNGPVGTHRRGPRATAVAPGLAPRGHAGLAATAAAACASLARLAAGHTVGGVDPALLPGGVGDTVYRCRCRGRLRSRPAGRDSC
jgi:hypothetical protein